MTERDQYIQSQVTPMLMPGERVLHFAFMLRQPGLAWQILLLGGLLLFLMTKAYYAVLTDRRLILLRTKQGFMKPQMVNIGVEEYEVAQMTQCTVSGFANNRSMTFHFRDGSKQTLRIHPWFKWVSGTKAFFEEVPQLINGGQLAAGAQAAGALAPAGASQAGGYGAGGYGAGGYGAGGVQQQAGGYGAGGVQQQAGGYGAGGMQQQAGGYGAGGYAAGGYGAGGMQQPAGGFGPGAAPPVTGGFAPGAQVMVAWSDGNRYPATVVQVHGDQILCAMQNGQQQWMPAQYVSAG